MRLFRPEIAFACARLVGGNAPPAILAAAWSNGDFAVPGAPSLDGLFKHRPLGTGVSFLGAPVLWRYCSGAYFRTAKRMST